jgi:unsaturated rhamnogalacturonyl hydrolase
VNAELVRTADPRKLGPWQYTPGLYLLGLVGVYERTHDSRYLTYAEGWVDSHVDASGHIDMPIGELDYILPGNLTLALFNVTHQDRYRLATVALRKALDDYPRTSDGAFWHASSVEDRHHQLWLDGTYMSLPFLARYGVWQGGVEKRHDESEALNQLLLYYKHLHDSAGGLPFHAYDESRQAPWANKVTGQSSVKWGRSIGWFAMALVDVLDQLPENEPHRQHLIAIMRELSANLAATQDAGTGLWFQVIDQPGLSGNWTETSCSSMFVYALDRAVKKGYIDSNYKSNVARGYKGVLARLKMGIDGLPSLVGICEGTNVGTVKDYLARARNDDDMHGLGAFLLMNEEVEFDHPAGVIVLGRPSGSVRQVSDARHAR